MWIISVTQAEGSERLHRSSTRIHSSPTHNFNQWTLIFSFESLFLIIPFQRREEKIRIFKVEHGLQRFLTLCVNGNLPSFLLCYLYTFSLNILYDYWNKTCLVVFWFFSTSKNIIEYLFRTLILRSSWQ